MRERDVFLEDGNETGGREGSMASDPPREEIIQCV